MIGASTFVPMPADAYVLAAAANLDPLWIGVVGGVINGAVVAGPERWFLEAAGDHPKMAGVRRFFTTGPYIGYLDRAMGLTLVVAGFSPVPFEPFRFVAVARGYPTWRYFLATATGRGLRFYWLAGFGAAIDDYPWSRYVVWFMIGLFIVGLVLSIRRYRIEARSNGVDDHS